MEIFKYQAERLAMEQSTKLPKVPRKSHSRKGIVAPIKSLIGKMKHSDTEKIESTEEGAHHGTADCYTSEPMPLEHDHGDKDREKETGADGQMGHNDGGDVANTKEQSGEEERVVMRESPAFMQMATSCPMTGEGDDVMGSGVNRDNVAESSAEREEQESQCVSVHSEPKPSANSSNLLPIDEEILEIAPSENSEIHPEQHRVDSPPSLPLPQTDRVFGNGVERIPSATPSWADRGSNDSLSDPSRDEHDGNMREEDIVRIESKYEMMESQCQELQATVIGMQQAIEQLESRIMDLEEEKKCDSSSMNNEELDRHGNDLEVHSVQSPRILQLQRSGWSEDHISFARSKWEDCYHTLFSYFMNGLMLIGGMIMRVFMVLTQIGAFVCSSFRDQSVPLHNESGPVDTRVFRRGQSRLRKRHRQRPS